MQEFLTNDQTTFLATDVFPSDEVIIVTSPAGYPDSTPFRIMIENEIMLVVDGAMTPSWSVTRALEDTDADFHPVNSELGNVLTWDGIAAFHSCRFSTGSRIELPSAELEGRLFLTDTPGWYFYRDDGTAWSAWGPVFKTNEKTLSDFEWVNQDDTVNGFAAVNVELGTMILEVPAPSVTGENVRMLVQDVTVESPTSAPYSVTAAFIPVLSPFDQTSCGLIFRESLTEQFIFFRVMYDETASVTKNDLVLSLDKYTDPTTLDSTYKTLSAGSLLGSLVWLKMEDDGVDLHWYFSNDGQNFELFDTEGRTDFLSSGPDEIGFAVDTNTTDGGAGMNLFSWLKE